MRNPAWRLILGVALVLLGVLALLQNIGGIEFTGGWWGAVFAVIFAAGGASFLSVLFADRQKNWWAVIPGFTLIALGAIILMGVLNFKPEELIGAVFLGGVGASFLFIYASDRTRWWAIIPGGVLATLAVITLLTNAAAWVPVILFGGMALTFGLVALTAAPTGHPRAWAWYPAGVFAVLAVITGVSSGPLPGLVWPILLIGAGLVMLAWTLVARRR